MVLRAVVASARSHLDNPDALQADLDALMRAIPNPGRSAARLRASGHDQRSVHGVGARGFATGDQSAGKIADLHRRAERDVRRSHGQPRTLETA